MHANAAVNGRGGLTLYRPQNSDRLTECNSERVHLIYGLFLFLAITNVHCPAIGLSILLSCITHSCLINILFVVFFPESNLRRSIKFRLYSDLERNILSISIEGFRAKTMFAACSR